MISRKFSAVDFGRFGVAFMDKVMDMAKTSAAGSFHLFIGKIVSTVILFVGSMVLTTLIPLESDYGLYAVALIPSSLLILFQDWGVGLALVRHCARCRAIGDKTDLRKPIVAGLTFTVLTGLLLTTFSLLTANIVAAKIFGEPNSTYLIAFVSVTIFSTALSGFVTNVFVGFERMKFVSLVLFVQAVAQSAVGPVLVYLGYGAFGAVVGYISGSVAASAFALILLYFAVFRKLEKVHLNLSEIATTLKPFLRYGIPLAIGGILSGILVQFNSFMMASYVADLGLIGNYRVATNFGVLLTFFSVPISTVIFPVFSKLDPRKEPDLLKTVFASSVKYTTLVIIPATSALIVLSQTIISALYGAKWSSAPQFSVLSVLANLFVIFGSIGATGLLNAMGETKTVMKLYLLTLTIGIPLAFVLIPTWGINGMIICSLVAGIPSLFAALYLVSKKYGVRVNFVAAAKILVSSILATITVYSFLGVFAGSQWLRLGLGTTIFLTVFFVSAPLLGAVNQADINNLRAMFSNLGILSKVLEIPLRIMEGIQKRTHVRKASPNSDILKSSDSSKTQ